MQQELINRVIGALLFVFIWLLFVYFLSRDWFNVLILAILSATYYEWCRICGLAHRGYSSVLWAFFVAIGVTSYMTMSQLEQHNNVLYQALIWFLAAALSLVWLLIGASLVYLVRRNIGFSRAYLRDIPLPWRVALLIAGVVLILPCLWFADFIYTQEEIGRRLLMFFIGTCIMMDVMAFFSGKTLGRQPLCPQISANKTVQGAVGGIVAASLWAVVGWFNYFQSVFPPVFVAAMCAVIFAAIVGDLFESLLKRLAQIKDSGTIVYGHGGMYDRIDSVVAACPVFVFIVCFFL